MLDVVARLANEMGYQWFMGVTMLGFGGVALGVVMCLSRAFTWAAVVAVVVLTLGAGTVSYFNGKAKVDQVATLLSGSARKTATKAGMEEHAGAFSTPAASPLSKH